MNNEAQQWKDAFAVMVEKYQEMRDFARHVTAEKGDMGPIFAEWKESRLISQSDTDSESLD